MSKRVVVKGRVVGDYKYDNQNIENLILEVMILKDLYELKFSVEQYIKDAQEYDRAISSAETISMNNLKSEIESLKESKI